MFSINEKKKKKKKEKILKPFDFASEWFQFRNWNILHSPWKESRFYLDFVRAKVLTPTASRFFFFISSPPPRLPGTFRHCL